MLCKLTSTTIVLSYKTKFRALDVLRSDASLVEMVHVSASLTKGADCLFAAFAAELASPPWGHGGGWGTFPSSPKATSRLFLVAVPPGAQPSLLWAFAVADGCGSGRRFCCGGLGPPKCAGNGRGRDCVFAICIARPPFPAAESEP